MNSKDELKEGDYVKGIGFYRGFFGIVQETYLNAQWEKRVEVLVQDGEYAYGPCDYFVKLTEEEYNQEIIAYELQK